MKKPLSPPMPDPIAPYDRQADILFADYTTLRFEQVHADWLDLAQSLPPASRVLDVGAGAGRDAAWFAGRGYPVLAVEPSRVLRTLACRHYPLSGLEWLDDRLPELRQVQARGLRFDLVIVSAVWMHLTPEQRLTALKALAALLTPGGRLVISLRFGPIPPDRIMYPVPVEELLEQVQALGLVVERRRSTADQLGRSAVCWQTLCLRQPSIA